MARLSPTSRAYVVHTRCHRADVPGSSSPGLLSHPPLLTVPEPCRKVLPCAGRGAQQGESPASQPSGGDGSSPTKPNTQSLPANTAKEPPNQPREPPEKPPEKPPENLPENPPEKPPENPPKKPAESPPEDLPASPPVKHHAVAEESHDGSEDDESADEESSEGGQEEEVYEEHEIPSSERSGSVSEKFPVIPVVAGSAALLVLLLLLFCVWYLCRQPEKEPLPPPPSPSPPSKEKVCGPQCPIMIFPCCECSRSSHPRHTEGRCLSFTPVRKPYMPMVCAPRLHLPPCCEQVPFPTCPPCCHSPRSCPQSSRTLPLIPPSPWALPPCPLRALPPKPKSVSQNC
ncbi:proline-rich receptor-like protein kinase PERK10 [Choloepus didactylus]|uniref:proline-rich receptor-like protein kinase PERK10 n=1 Tax=Choloepus didactylus TaxID=27675 RepID=UPI0018A06BD7|nr:proline-rich receptor-like protein kinase PERK10 [Choloepus didactylus]